MGRGWPSKIQLPMTAQLLCQIRSSTECQGHPERLLVWAVCCTAVLWLGELLLSSNAEFDPARHLTWGDMAADNPQNPRVIKFHLRRSKTDQFGQGAGIILGRTSLDLCPVAAALTYVGSRSARPGPFFLATTSKPL